MKGVSGKQMINSDLDMSEYPVDRMSWTKDIFFGVFSFLRLHMINETIRNEDPGKEARAKGKKTKKTSRVECQYLMDWQRRMSW